MTLRLGGGSGALLPPPFAPFCSQVEFENSRHLLSREGISALHADIAAWEQSILNEMRASLPQKRGSQSGRGRVAPRQAPPPGPM